MCTSENNQPKILVIMTGGTICSSTNAQGHRYANAKAIKIIDHFKSGSSPFRDVDFDTEMPLNILSENMTVDSWNTLLAHLRTVAWDNYKGVIILHGTDTLAYMSSLLSVVLAGIKVPVCMVSSQLPLDEPGTNGHANFRASVELIMNGIAPNVYAVYRNSNGVIYVHYGAHLMQCANYSDDFYSADPMEITNPENACARGRAFETAHFYLKKMAPLTPCVLQLVPYVGIDYSVYNLDGIRAVVHGIFHSESVCVERSKGQGEYSVFSILHLMDRCKKQGVQLFLTPCSPKTFKYESTSDILNHGASYIAGTTVEMAYIKALVGCALGLQAEQLQTFVLESINHETIR